MDCLLIKGINARFKSFCIQLMKNLKMTNNFHTAHYYARLRELITNWNATSVRIDHAV